MCQHARALIPLHDLGGITARVGGVKARSAPLREAGAPPRAPRKHDVMAVCSTSLTGMTGAMYVGLPPADTPVARASRTSRGSRKLPRAGAAISLIGGPC
jgi:hypothetical protein